MRIAALYRCCFGGFCTRAAWQIELMRCPLADAASAASAKRAADKFLSGLLASIGTAQRF